MHFWYESLSPSGHVPTNSSSFEAILYWCDKTCTCVCICVYAYVCMHTCVCVHVHEQLQFCTGVIKPVFARARNTRVHRHVPPSAEACADSSAAIRAIAASRAACVAMTRVRGPLRCALRGRVFIWLSRARRKPKGISRVV